MPAHHNGSDEPDTKTLLMSTTSLVIRLVWQDKRLPKHEAGA